MLVEVHRNARSSSRRPTAMRQLWSDDVGQHQQHHDHQRHAKQPKDNWHFHPPGFIWASIASPNNVAMESKFRIADLSYPVRRVRRTRRSRGTASERAAPPRVRARAQFPGVTGNDRTAPALTNSAPELSHRGRRSEAEAMGNGLRHPRHKKSCLKEHVHVRLQPPPCG